MRSDTVADSGVYAPRHFCDIRVGVQVDKIQRSLLAAGGEGVGNLLAHPSAPTVDCGVTQVSYSPVLPPNPPGLAASVQLSPSGE